MGKWRPNAAKYDFQTFPRGLQTRGLTISWCLMGTWGELLSIWSSLLSYRTILVKEGHMDGSAPVLSLRFVKQMEDTVTCRNEAWRPGRFWTRFLILPSSSMKKNPLNYCVLPGICLQDAIFNFITIVACLRLQITCTFYLHMLLFSDPTCRKTNSKIE